MKWISVLVLALAAGCAKAPGRRGGGEGEQAPATPAATSAAAPEVPEGELPADPALGGRKPLPPMPGARTPLPPPTGSDAGTAVPAAGAMPFPPMPMGADEEAGPLAGSAVPPSAGPAAAVTPAAIPLTETPGTVPTETLEVPGLAETPPAAPPPAETPSATPEVFAAGNLTIRRFVLCKSVENREPVEPTSTFKRERDGQVWAYIDAGNTGAEAQRVVVMFEAVDRPGAAAPPVSLEIGTGARFRTWVRASTWRAPGRYRVVVRDAAGNVLARASFEVIE